MYYTSKQVKPIWNSFLSTIFPQKQRHRMIRMIRLEYTDWTHSVQRLLYTIDLAESKGDHMSRTI